MTPGLKFIHWIAIYPADSSYQLFEQPGPDPKSATQADTVLKKTISTASKFLNIELKAS